MHITVMQGIQAIAANARREMYPEELDWILNMQMMQYIGTHASALRDNPGAADSLVHLSRLTSLLSSVELDSHIDDKVPWRVRSVIPYDVAEMLSAESEVQNLCGSAPKTARSRNNLVLLPMKKSTATSQWYKDVVITIDGDEVFNMQKYAQARGVTFNGFQAADELWRALAIIGPELSSRYEVHWETYGTLYYPYHFIIAGLDDVTADVVIDGTATSAQNEAILQTKYVAESPKRMPARLYFQTNVHHMRVGAFSRTDARSPLCLFEQDQVVTEVSDSFIVGSTILNYVRKPRRIDLSLNQQCELPESAHPDICNLAIEHVKMLREDPDWEVKLKENMLRTTI